MRTMGIPIRIRRRGGKAIRVTATSVDLSPQNTDRRRRKPVLASQHIEMTFRYTHQLDKRLGQLHASQTEIDIDFPLDARLPKSGTISAHGAIANLKRYLTADGAIHIVTTFAPLRKFELAVNV